MPAAATIYTLYMLAFTTSGLGASLALVAVSVTPFNFFFSELASGFCGGLGGVMVQLWTMDVRRPTKKVVCADMIASFWGGIAVSVVGVPTFLAGINKYLMPEDVQLAIDPAKLLWGTLLLAVLGGALAAGLIRKLFDRLNPNWGKNGNTTP